MAGPEQEPGEPVEGPDPRHWPAHAPDLWSLVLDLEHIGRALSALNGPVPPEEVPAHGEAMRFLRESASQLRAYLAAEVLGAYRISPVEASPFEGAGKPRAFGADPAPEQPTA